GTGTGLEDVDGELFIVLPTNNLVCRGGNRLGLFIGDHAQLMVCDGASFFDQAQCVNVGGFKTLTGNWKVFYGTLSLCRVQCTHWYPDFAHRVMFDTELLIIRLRCHNPHPMLGMTQGYVCCSHKTAGQGFTGPKISPICTEPSDREYVTAITAVRPSLTALATV